MQRLLPIAAAVLALAGVSAAPIPATQAACGSIAAGGSRYIVRIERGSPGCVAARAVLKQFIASTTVKPRWVCFRGHGAQRWAAACARGQAIVRAYPRA